MTTDRIDHVIVVGVDGSEASKDALRWAARQAELTGARLRVVRAWQTPPSYGYAVDYSDLDLEGETRKDLDQIVDGVLGRGDHGRVVTQVTEGHPAAVLIEAARDADLLVVGSRGHGAFAGMLLGSVSAHCVHHAACPVLVARHRRS